MKGYKMKKMMIIVVTLLSLSSFVHAGTRCSTDFFGNYNCTSSGNTGTWSSTTTTDFFGNDNTTIRSNGSSSTYRCSTDFFGNYNCY